MYAAKNGHLECVKELVKDQFLKFDVKNKARIIDFVCLIRFLYFPVCL